MEIEIWKREMKKRPLPPVKLVEASDHANNYLTNRKRKNGVRHGYRTRAARDEEQNDDENVKIIYFNSYELNF